MDEMQVISFVVGLESQIFQQKQRLSFLNRVRVGDGFDLPWYNRAVERGERNLINLVKKKAKTIVDFEI